MPVEVKNVPSATTKQKLNYPARRNIKFQILRNGVPSFKGICFPYKIASCTSVTQLLSEISLALKYKVFIHKGGVKCLYSTDGTEITSLEQLNDGQTYIATCLNEKFKHDNYPITSRPATATSRLSVKQSCTATSTVSPQMDLVVDPQSKGRRSMSLVSHSKTASQNPSNIKLSIGKSAGNIQPKSGKSLADIPARNRKLKLIRLGAPKDGDTAAAIAPETGASTRRSMSISGTRAIPPRASVATRRSFSMSASNALSKTSTSCTPACEKTRSTRRSPEKSITKPRVSASETPVRPSTNSRQASKISASKTSTCGSRGNTVLAKADAKPIAKRTIPTASSCSTHRRSDSINRMAMTKPKAACIKIQHRWITIVRHGIKPRLCYRILLNHNTPNFESIMNKISGTMKFSSEAKVFFETCIAANRYEDFFTCHFIFFAFPSMSVQWEDFDIHPKEEEDIERLNKISMLRHNISSADVPKCITSKYDIRNALSYGCFSLLVLCTEKSTQTTQALKIIRKVHGNEVMEANLIKNKAELDYLSILKNSNIIQVFFQHETVDALFFIEDYFNGGDLHKLIESPTRILEEEAWSFIGDIMCALRYLHNADIVHRDVSATNLMININHEGIRQLKLCDFSLATRVKGAPLTDSVGFLLYMAPEMIMRKGYGCKVDVWGAGVTLYYILGQTLPFLADSVDESRRMILGHTAVGLSFEGAGWDEVTDSMKSLISAMLVRNDRRRITAAEAYDFIHKENETNDYVPTEKDQETPRETDTTLQNLRGSSSGEMKRSDIVASEEPENIYDFSLCEKRKNSTHSIIDVITLSDKTMEYNRTRSITSELGRQKSNFSSAELSCKETGVEPEIFNKSSGMSSDLGSKRSDIKPEVYENRSNTKPELNSKFSESRSEIQRKHSEGTQELLSKCSDSRSFRRCESNEEKPVVKSKRSVIRPEVTGKRSNSKPELQGKYSETNSDLQMKRSEEKPVVQSKRSDIRQEVTGKRSNSKPELQGKCSEINADLQEKRSEEKPEVRSKRSDIRPEVTGKRSSSKPEGKCSEINADFQIKCSEEKPEVKSKRSDIRPEVTGKRSSSKPELQGECSEINADLQMKGSEEKPEVKRKRSDIRPEVTGKRSNSKPELQGKCSETNPDLQVKRSEEKPEVKIKRSDIRPEVTGKRTNSKPELQGKYSEINTNLQMKRSEEKPEVQSKRSDIRPEVTGKRSNSKPELQGKYSETNPDLQVKRSEEKPEVKSKRSDIRPEVTGKRSNSKPEVQGKCSEVNANLQMKRSEEKPEVKSKHSDIRPEGTGKRSNSKLEQKGKSSEINADLQIKCSKEKSAVTVKHSNAKTVPESTNSGTFEQLPSERSETKPDIQGQLSDTTQELPEKTSEIQPVFKSQCNDLTPELQRKYSNVMHELKIKCTGSNSAVTERCSETEEGLRNNEERETQPEEQVRCSEIIPELETKCGLKLEGNNNDAELEFEFDCNEARSSIDCVGSDITQRTFSIESDIGQDIDCKEISSIEALETVRSATLAEYDQAIDCKQMSSIEALEPVRSDTLPEYDQDIDCKQMSSIEALETVRSATFHEEDTTLSDDDSDIQSDQNDSATEIQTVQNVLKPELSRESSNTLAKTASQRGEVTQELHSDETIPEVQIICGVVSRELKDKLSNSTGDQSKSSGPTLEVNKFSDDNSGHSDTDMSNFSEDAPTISTVPSDHNEYYSCPGYEKEDTDNSETEIQAFALDSGTEHEHQAATRELIRQKAEDAKQLQEMEAIVFQGFGDEKSHHSILIQVGEHDVDEYKDNATNEVCPDTVTDQEDVEEVITRGYQILQHIHSGEMGRTPTGRYDESPYF